MGYGLTVVDPPTVEPITLAQAKLHLQIDIDDQDAEITQAIKAARKYAEDHTKRFFLEQVVRLKLNCWPANGVIQLIPFGGNDVTAIEEFTYLDVDGDEQDVVGYQVEFSVNPPLIALSPGGAWPDLESDRLYPIAIDLTVGAESADDLDPRIGQAIRLTLGYWNQDRGDANLATVAGSLGLPVGARRLLDSIWSGSYG